MIATNFRCENSVYQDMCTNRHLLRWRRSVPPYIVIPYLVSGIERESPQGIFALDRGYVVAVVWRFTQSDYLYPKWTWANVIEVQCHRLGFTHNYISIIIARLFLPKTPLNRGPHQIRVVSLKIKKIILRVNYTSSTESNATEQNPYDDKKPYVPNPFCALVHCLHLHLFTRFYSIVIS